ncbi:MAG: hypothetical protein E7323_01330 [Clostridiales bacterium]|nr:hypothetical protein [Clostridiales bacterium]
MNKVNWKQLLLLLAAAFAGLITGLLVTGEGRKEFWTMAQPALVDSVAVFSHEGQPSFSIAAVDAEMAQKQGNGETPVPEEGQLQQTAVMTGQPAASPAVGADTQQAETDLAPDASAFSIVPLGTGWMPETGKILIYHTHTYEAYEPNQQPYQETERWRTADAEYNMVRVGEELAQLLRGLGYAVEHDITAFEPPDLGSAYTRSLAMLEARAEAGESYDLYIDLHRDAFVEGQSGANTVTIGGVETARLMLLIGKGEGYTDAGYDQKPDWETNLAFAQTITDALNQQTPNLCKEVRLKSGRFNQHVAKNCVLIEVGNNRNTLQQALAAMPYLADAIHAALCP